MTKLNWGFLLWLVGLTIAAAPSCAGASPIPCRTVRGRMQITNGVPTVRIWIVGSKRILGVVQQDTTFNQLPANVRRAWSDDDKPWEHLLYGDFRVCPLTPYHKGWMQDVRVVGGKNLRREDL